MSDPGPDKDSSASSASSAADELRADIEATRAQLAEAAEALAAKLDAKAQAEKLAKEAADKAAAAYDSAKQSAPEPVLQAIEKVEQTAAPVVAKAGEDKPRTALLIGGLVLAVLIVVRLRRGRSAR